jgi:hypothetical protein
LAQIAGDESEKRPNLELNQNKHLEAELSLGSDCYSDLEREITEYLGVDVTYAKVTGMFARILGQKLSTNAVSKMVTEEAAGVEAYYEQKPAPKPADEGEILVIQADGKGVPMVRETSVQAKVRLGKGEKRTKKKEAIVTGNTLLLSLLRMAWKIRHLRVRK